MVWILSNFGSQIRVLARDLLFSYSMKLLVLLFILIVPILVVTTTPAHASCVCEPYVGLDKFCASTSSPQTQDSGVSEVPEACCDVCGAANGTPSCDQCQVYECELLLSVEPTQTVNESNAGCNTGGSPSGKGASLLLFLMAFYWPRIRSKCR